jgi:hypothetical protein
MSGEDQKRWYIGGVSFGIGECQARRHVTVTSRCGEGYAAFRRGTLPGQPGAQEGEKTARARELAHGVDGRDAMVIGHSFHRHIDVRIGQVERLHEFLVALDDEGAGESTGSTPSRSTWPEFMLILPPRFCRTATRSGSTFAW